MKREDEEKRQLAQEAAHDWGRLYAKESPGLHPDVLAALDAKWKAKSAAEASRKELADLTAKIEEEQEARKQERQREIRKRELQDTQSAVMEALEENLLAVHDGLEARLEAIESTVTAIAIMVGAPGAVEALAKASTKVAEAAKTLAKPRRRVAYRDKQGDITHTIETTIEDGGADGK